MGSVDHAAGHRRPLVRILVGAFFCLGVLHVGMILRWGTAPVMVNLPWVVPVTNALVMLAAWSVALLSFGRHAVLRDPVSFWTGIGFAAMGTCQVFHVLAWPGLLPDGRAMIGHLPSTAAWIAVLTLSLPGVCLLAAVWARWPREGDMAGDSWLWWVGGCLAFLILLNIAVVALEHALPTLVETSGRFTPLLQAWQWGVTLLFGLGAFASARYYLKTGDTLPGYTAFSQMFLFFFELVIVFGNNRHGQLYFADRFLVIGGFLAMLLGLLLEYVQLYRRGQERARDLAVASAKLRQSEERYHRLFEDDLTGDFISTPEGRILLCNPAFVRMFGFSSTEAATGTSVRELYPDPREREELVERVRKQGKVERFEVWRKRLDGTLIHIVENLVGHFNERGELYEIKGYLFDDTERKQAEQGLRESEEKYRTLFESIDEGFCTIEVLFDENQKAVDYRFLTVNPAFERQAGIRDPVGRRMREIVPLHEEEWFRIYGQVALTGEPVRFENSAAQLGRTYDVYALRIGAPADHKVAVLFNDITARKRAELSLKASEARMERAQAIAHLGSWELDVTNDDLAWSDEVYRIFGFEPQSFEPSYEAFLQAVHPEDRAAVNAAYVESLREGKDTYEIEHRVVRAATGEVRIVHEKCEHLRDHTGRVIRSQGMVHDITERKRTEEALQRSEARLMQGVQVAGLGVFEHDHQSDVIELSTVMRQLLGFGEAEEISIPAIVQKVFPEDRETLASRIRQAHDPRGDGHFEVDYRVERAGGVRWVSARSQTFFAGEGPQRRAVRTIGAALDVTERKEAQAQLEELVSERTAQLAEANANLQHFAYTAAHDLRSPLRAINGFAGLLLEEQGQRLDAMGRSMMERIVTSAGQMAKLLDDLLEYSRLSEAELRVERVELSLAVQEALKLQESDIRSRQAEVTVADSLPAVMGHSATLVMIIANLVSNGLKFVAPGIQPRMRIWTEVAADGAGVKLWVQDNGIGIEAQNQEKVFGVFQRLHGKGTYQGTGLGLAIVRKAVERMDGRVGVESELSQGSRFWVELIRAD